MAKNKPLAPKIEKDVDKQVETVLRRLGIYLGIWRLARTIPKLLAKITLLKFPLQTRRAQKNETLLVLARANAENGSDRL